MLLIRPYCNPYTFDASGNPPTLISVGALDHLKNDSIAWAHRLHDAGVPLKVVVYNGMCHGYLNAMGVFPQVFVPTPSNCVPRRTSTSGKCKRKKDRPCNPTYFRDQFKKALKDIPEVRTLTPYSCRHTYVSQLQALGADLATIQSIVGHADIDMTQHYLHVQNSIRLDALSIHAFLFK